MPWNSKMFMLKHAHISSAVFPLLILEGPPERLPGSHYALSMQMMALKTQQEMATLAKLIPQEKGLILMYK